MFHIDEVIALRENVRRMGAAFEVCLFQSAAAADLCIPKALSEPEHSLLSKKLMCQSLQIHLLKWECVGKDQQ